MELTTTTDATAIADTTAAEVAILAAVARHVEQGAEEGTEEHLRSVYAQVDESAAAKAAKKLAKVMAPHCPSLRAARLWACAVEGAGLADLRYAVQADRSGLESVPVATRYAGMSRGKCWGRHADGSWAPKDGAKVLLDQPGKWTVGSDDGFTRKERSTWTVKRVGPYLFAEST